MGVAWTAWRAVLAGGEMVEFYFAPIRVPVDVDVGDAHGGGGNVCMACLAGGDDILRCSRSAYPSMGLYVGNRNGFNSFNKN